MAATGKDQTPIVYLVDDEDSVREALTDYLGLVGRTVLSFKSAMDFLHAYDPEQSGCLLLDVRMPEMTGHQLQEVLLEKGINIPIIFISGHADITGVAKAFKAGAIDFLEKPFNNKTLQLSIDEAIKKDIAFRQESANKNCIQERFNSLSGRESEVLALIADGKSNKEVALLLEISHRTVDIHRSKILEKMQAENLAKLITMFMLCKA